MYQVGGGYRWGKFDELRAVSGRDAQANSEYMALRRKNFKLPRRIAADFLIGAHAAARGYSLLTFDKRTFRAAFPALDLS